MDTKKFSIAEAIRFGFYTFFDHFIFFIKVGLAYCGIMLGLLIFDALILLPFASTLGPVVEDIHTTVTRITATGSNTLITIINNGAVKQIVHDMTPSLGLSFVFLLITLLGISVYQWLSLGIIRIYLDMHDTGSSNIKRLFSCGSLVGKSIGAGILYWLIVFAGSLLFVVPGIIWAIQFGFYKQILVDKNTGIVEALKQSSAISYGAKTTILGFLILFWLINWVASLLFGIGLLITYPAMALAFIYVYCTLRTQTGINRYY